MLTLNIRVVQLFYEIIEVYITGVCDFIKSCKSVYYKINIVNKAGGASVQVFVFNIIFEI